MEIRNKFGEKIDFMVEGNEKAGTTVVFAHGFGTNKDEGGLFVDIANALSKDFRIVRFDFSGYGKSEGKEEDANLQKHTFDLEAVLDFVRKNYPGKIDIIAHSMGTFVACLLSPRDIEKAILTSPPNPDVEKNIENKKNKLIERGGAINENGISKYPRTSGKIQNLGAGYWKAMREFKSLEKFSKFSQKTKLYLFKPLQDEISVPGDFSGYENIDSLEYFELNGSHNYSKLEDRKILIKNIQKIL